MFVSSVSDPDCIMKFCLLIPFLLLGIHSLPAIDSYQPGDTLYVWAASGLTLRKAPALTAAKLSSVPYGTRVIALNYFNGHDTEVEAVPGFMAYNQKIEAVMLGGAFACVVFAGDTGYLFDAYLSKLPALKRSKEKAGSEPGFENFDTWAKRNFGLVAEEHHGTREYGTPSSSRMVYANGFVVSGWSEKDGRSRTILPDVSMEEAFLLFNYLNGYERDVRLAAKNQPCANFEECWSFTAVSKFEWGFGEGLCGYKILYLPEEKIVIITTECSC